MTQINITGQIFDSTGYSSHTRNLANALFNLVPTRLSVPLVPNWNMQVNDKELEMIKRKPEKGEINLIITNPLYWKLNLGLGRNFCYLIWEGDRIPKCFIEECLNPKIEYILVPSNHTKNAILKTMEEFNSAIQCFLPSKIRIIPHGVDLNLFYPKEKPSKCTFVCNKGLRGPEDRGGIQYAIKAYIEEFTNEDVELILRINPAYGIINMDDLLRSMNIQKNSNVIPKITIHNEPLEYKDLVKLYNQGTVFVSPTRAEAFNIPCLEAMACGLPCITTNFGGQTDFCNESNSWIIGGELTEVKWDLMYESISWLTPCYQDLRKALRWCFEHNEDVNIKSQKAIETAKQLTWDNSAKQLINLI